MAIAGQTRSPLTSLDSASVWINSEPLRAAGLRRHVVLVQFWTYSCINWLRTLPYVRAWNRRYGGRGLVVVGAHAPEFGFEHDLENVRQACRELEVDHPVVIDNGFAIWRGFENRYWPALYLLDGEGRVRFQHFGEGFYSETEQAIQQLLGVDEELSAVNAGGLAAAADLANLRSPETYLGTARGEGRRTGGAESLALNEWELTGRWSVGPEAAVLDAPAGSIGSRFQARDVNLVVAPPPTVAVPFKVLLDGHAPGDDKGLDIEAAGTGIVATPRMYQLIRRRHAQAPGTFEIEFEEPGVLAYVLTFG
jgi:hypothetical protein